MSVCVRESEQKKKLIKKDLRTKLTALLLKAVDERSTSTNIPLLTPSSNNFCQHQSVYVECD